MKSVMHWQKQSQTKGKQHLDVFQTTYYLINSIITSAFCRHKNSVIPKLTNFNSALLTTSDSEPNPLPVHALFKEALKWTKPKLPLFNQVYSLKQIWTSNQIEEIYPILIFFLKKPTKSPKRSLLSFISSFRFNKVFYPCH